MKLVAVAVAVAALGCGAKPTAESVCRQIEAAGVGKGCTSAKPEMMSARARTRFNFDLVHVPGKTGQVLDFASGDDYDATEKAFAAAALLAGPHRYGNASTRIFVQVNSGASLDDGKALAGIVGAPAPAWGAAPASAATTSETAPTAAAPTEKPLAVTATALFDDYQANEVSADDKYKGKRLRVVGQLASIDKNAVGGMVLEIKAGTSILAKVAAHVVDSEKEKVAGLAKNQIVAVECVGGTMVLKRPTLQNCTILIEGKKL